MFLALCRSVREPRALAAFVPVTLIGLMLCFGKRGPEVDGMASRPLDNLN
jgi:hypothetical protein